MLLTFKKTRIAGAMALAFTMAATSLSAGGTAQTPNFGAISIAGNFGAGLAELTQVNHRKQWLALQQAGAAITRAAVAR